MTRGEVWWAVLPDPIGARPVVLVMRSAAYAYRSVAIVAPVTSRVRGIRAEVPLGTAEGLARDSVVNCDSLHTVERSALQTRLGRLSGPKLRAVDDALRFALGLD